MIYKINKIKNLGLVFSDYTRDTNLPIFKRYNLIYGWNGCGKTTFSKLFNALENGGDKNIPNLEYEIESENGKIIKQGENLNQKVRVFNQDFVEKNITILEGKANSITLILGDSSKTILSEIENDIKKLSSKIQEQEKHNSQLQEKIKQKDKTFSEISKTISFATIGGAIRNYRRDDAEKDFSNLKHYKILSEKELEIPTLIVKQTSKPTINWAYGPKQNLKTSNLKI